MTQITTNENIIKQEELNDVTTAYTHKFSKPVEYNGKRYEELHFDFDALTGRDCLNISAELATLGKGTFLPAFNDEYLIRFAARACTENMVGSDIFEVMKSTDFLRITSRARSFLLHAD